jgi:hypothetical protein
MTLTRTRLILIGIVGALVVLGAVLGTVLRDGGGGEAGTGGAAGFTNNALAELAVGDEAALAPGGRFEAQLDGEVEEYAAPPGLPATSADSLSEADGSPALDPKLQGLLDRKIIQSTSVDVEVKEVGRSFQDIIRIAETAGGFVASSSFSNVNDEQIADLTIRVPGDRYQGVLAQIRGMGEVTQESSDANDVTEEYTDLQARLRTLEATERRYLELLGQADEISDILLVQDRLDSVRGQIEQVQGRINMLEHLTDLATITAHLRPEAAAVELPAEDGGLSPFEAAGNAWESSLEALRGLATVALVIGAFSWWLVPPLAAMGFGARWWLSRRPRPATETPA